MVRREAPGDRQHEGEGPHPERQLRLLQPAGAHPHRALGQEAQQDRDSEAGRIVGKINVGAVLGSLDYVIFYIFPLLAKYSPLPEAGDVLHSPPRSPATRRFVKNNLFRANLIKFFVRRLNVREPVQHSQRRQEEEDDLHLLCREHEENKDIFYLSLRNQR